jgi:hypothetical protein
LGEEVMKKKFNFHPFTFPLFVFSILLLLLYLQDYFTLLHKAPFGVHFIRQTDTTAFGENYLFRETPFWQPHIWHLDGGEGKAASEFPLLYWIVAKIALYTGSNLTFLMRLTALSCFLLSFITTAFYIKNKLRHWLLSVSILFLCFSSPLLFIYCAAPLPDILGVSFTLSGCFLALRSSSRRSMILAALCFSLASTLKITFLIYPIGFLAESLWKNGRTFNWKSTWTYLSPIIVSIGWYAYAKWYNSLHSSTHFLMDLKPIWNLSQQDISVVLKYISEYWQTTYWYPTTIHFIGLSLLASFWLRTAKHSHTKLLRWWTLGIILYGILFFQQFKDHDYYVIVCLPVVMLWIVDFAQRLISHFQHRMFIPIVAVLFSILTVLSTNYALLKASRRLDDSIYTSQERSRLFLDTRSIDLLTEMIAATETVLVVGDESSNGSLGLIRRRGSFVFPNDTIMFSQRLKKYKCDYILLLGEQATDYPLPRTYEKCHLEQLRPELLLYRKVSNEQFTR